MTFKGFESPRSNTTYTPNQFFDVCVPNCTRGATRLVGLVLRRTLGWCDSQGNPQEEQVLVSYQDLIDHAGISRGMIGPSIREAIDGGFIRCVREGSPCSSQTAAVTALYELQWDDRDEYIKDPKRFKGFFGGEGNRTDIPNQFFDHILPNESLSVIKVVASIIRFSIGFQAPHGRRRQVISLSYNQIQNYAHILNRTTLSEAIQRALEQNYILRTEEGFFTSDKVSQISTQYTLRWLDSDLFSLTGQKKVPENLADQSEKGTRESGGSGQKKVPENPVDQSEKRTRELGSGSKNVPENPTERFEKRTRESEGSGSKNVPENPTERFEKRTRGGSKNVPEERFEKRTSIIRKEMKHLNERREMKQQQPEETKSAAAVSLPETLLRKIGFDQRTAQQLAKRYDQQQIENQIAWINHRQPSRNPLGMLRRAIEENWPPPSSLRFESPQIAESLGRDFAQHFYAGYNGNKAHPIAEPSTKDMATAERFVNRLLEIWPDAHQVKFWGRQFGEVVRERQRFSESPIISLVLAVRSYGDEFFSNHQARGKMELERVQMAAQERHFDQFEATWLKYLKAEERRLKRGRDYAAFLAERDAERKRIGWDPNPAQQLAIHDSEATRLQSFRRFFRDSVFDFWDWDEKINPNGWKEPDPV